MSSKLSTRDRVLFAVVNAGSGVPLGWVHLALGVPPPAAEKDMMEREVAANGPPRQHIDQVVEAFVERGLLARDGDMLTSPDPSEDPRHRIDPAVRDALPPRTKEERSAIAYRVLTGKPETLHVWKHAGHAVLIDDHDVAELAARLGKEVEIKEVVGVHDAEDAVSWRWRRAYPDRVLTRQAMSYCRGRAYNLSKKQQGRPAKDGQEQTSQTDRFSTKLKQVRDTAARVAAEYGVSPATIMRDADYASWLDRITEVGGMDIRKGILARQEKQYFLSVDEVKTLAEKEDRTVRRHCETLRGGTKPRLVTKPVTSNPTTISVPANKPATEQTAKLIAILTAQQATDFAKELLKQAEAEQPSGDTTRPTSALPAGDLGLARDLDTIAGHLGEEYRQAILSGDARLSSEEIRTLAGGEPAEPRPRVPVVVVVPSTQPMPEDQLLEYRPSSVAADAEAEATAAQAAVEEEPLDEGLLGQATEVFRHMNHTTRLAFVSQPLVLAAVRRLPASLVAVA